MRARVAPRLTALAPELAGRVRRASCYRWPSWSGDPIVYSCERLVDAAEILAASGFQVLEALEHAVPAVREAARLWVDEFKIHRSAPILLRQFRDPPEPHERQEIGTCLAYLKAPAAIRQLAQWMREDPDPEFRHSAACALIWCEDFALGPLFLEVVQDPLEVDPVRQTAMEGVAYLLHRHGLNRRSAFYLRATRALFPHLDHPDERYRYEAVFALARCARARPRLRRMACDDPSPLVAEEARRMLP